MNKAFSKCAKFLSLLRRKDYYAALESLLTLLQTAGVYLHVTDILSCASTQNVSPADGPDIIIRAIHPDEIPLIATFENKDERKLQERIREWGDECRGIFYREEIAGYGWISRKKIRIPEVSFARSLRINELYLYNGFIRKEFRNRGLWVYFLRDLISKSKRQSEKVYSTADLTNRKARLIKLKNGFQRDERIILIRVGSILEHKIIRDLR